MSDEKKSEGVIKILVVSGETEHHPECPDHPDNARSGPSKAATKAFRDGWEVTFGKVTVGNA